VNSLGRRRRDVDDDAVSTVDHRRQCGAAGVQGGHQRPVDLRPDLGVAELGERLEVDCSADIVDQYVDAVKRRKRLLYH
jgi:hypothetical protein